MGWLILLLIVVILLIAVGDGVVVGKIVYSIFGLTREQVMPIIVVIAIAVCFFFAISIGRMREQRVSDKGFKGIVITYAVFIILALPTLFYWGPVNKSSSYSSSSSSSSYHSSHSSSDSPHAPKPATGYAVSYYGDPFGVGDYEDAEEFADDWFDYFDSWEAAEEYWENHY